MKYFLRVFSVLFIFFFSSIALAGNQALPAIFQTLLLNSSDSAFITTWQTTTADETITLPLLEGIYNYNFQVDWGDGSPVDTITAWDDPKKTHTYATAGNYDVSITGICEAFTFNNTGDKEKLIDVKNWGNISWRNLAGMFYGCTNITTFSATDAPDLSNITSLQNTFKNASMFNSDISSWDTSTIIYMIETFAGASSFNQPLDSWDMSNVTSVGHMFENATSFNQDLNSWNLASLTNTNSTFNGCSAFNGNIASWNMSGVTDARRMFFNCTSFNQNIGSWDVSNVPQMDYMLRGCTVFNQDISGWDTSSVTSMYAMFTNATAFDQNIASWDISNVTDMSFMLKNAGLSTANYDALLIGWEAQTVQTGVPFGADGLTYTSGSASETARTNLINNSSWIIIDGGGI